MEFTPPNTPPIPHHHHHQYQYLGRYQCGWVAHQDKQVSKTCTICIDAYALCEGVSVMCTRLVISCKPCFSQAAHTPTTRKMTISPISHHYHTHACLSTTTAMPSTSRPAAILRMLVTRHPQYQLPITNYQMALSKQGAGGGSATHKEPT